MKNIAPLSLRIIAALIDCSVGMVIFFLITLSVVSATSVQGILNSGLRAIVLILLLLPVVIPLIYLILIVKTGGSVGKLLTGIAIATPKGSNVSFSTAFFREIVGKTASRIFVYLGYIWIIVDKNRQGWHDMIADTYVIRKTTSGFAAGGTALIILLGINGYLGYRSVTEAVRNWHLYQEIFNDVRTELAKPQQNSAKVPYNFILTPTPTDNVLQNYSI